MSESCKVMYCGCIHNGQDILNGSVRLRVFNQTRESDGKIYRCTVCGNQKGYNLTEEEAKKLSKGKR